LVFFHNIEQTKVLCETISSESHLTKFCRQVQSWQVGGHQELCQLIPLQAEYNVLMASNLDGYSPITSRQDSPNVHTD